MNNEDLIEELYTKLHDAGFVVEFDEDSFVVSFNNRPVFTAEVKVATGHDERFTYTQKGGKVIVR